MKPTEIQFNKIAPCGINCALCYAFQRNKKPCEGCVNPNENTPNYCKKCSVIYCEELELQGSNIDKHFCYSCSRYPCRRLKQLDKRYRMKYGVSNLDNLKMIQKNGLEAFIKSEQNKWKCRSCGELLCVHRNSCIHCGEINQYYQQV